MGDKMGKIISTATEVYHVNENGDRHGECKDFGYGGRGVKSVSNFENGKRQGIRTYYGEDRSIIAEYHYVNGKRHGECKNFHDNGKVGIKQNYKDGMRHGKRYEYDSDGVLVYVGLYFEDKEIIVDVLTLSEADYAYIMISGRLPMRGW
jgi:antitoxin component YwqK of YwqJK toxin-antitoxin module